MTDDLLDAVDENDVVIATLPKKEFYERGMRSRIINVAVIDPKTKKIAIQIRGKDVSWQPLHYCMSAVGHVDSGETWEVAARRELFEEMGIDAPVTMFHKQAFVDEFDYPYMIGLFTAEADHTSLKTSAREVEHIMSLDRAEIDALLDKGENIHNLLRVFMDKLPKKAA